jgi:ketol-acid reductoisomerase
MKRVLGDIQSGKFARAWMDENKSGGKKFADLRSRAAAHPIEAIGAKLRAMMPWISKT